MGPPRLLLVDCDAFFVQVARLEDPEGAGRAALLIVGGSPSGRGVVTSASYEARKFGVRSAMPTAEALRLCPGATVAPVRREAISRRSSAVREALESLAPVVEAASVDEFYLDLSGTERLFRGETLEGTARRIQARVLEQTSVQVSIGGGTRRLIAKVAANRAKPAGVRIVPPGREAAFMGELDLVEIPGVGPVLTEALAGRGLVTVKDALRVGDAWLARWFGPDRARWLGARIRGEDGSAVRPHDPRRTISSERTYGADLTEDVAMEREVLRLGRSVASSLRAEGLGARTVSVKQKSTDFTVRQASRTLGEPIDSDAAVWQVARSLLRALRKKRDGPVRLLGVGLGGLVPLGDGRQLTLFPDDPLESERDRTLSRLRDDLRARLGTEGVQPARLLDPPPRGG